MKDTVIKGNGKSRIIKAPTDMPTTFEEWRAQLLAGTATLDIGLNAAGCDVVGTPMSKANLLSNATKTALGLSEDDPTVNNALYALSQKDGSAEAHVYADVGTTVTMSKNGKTLTATVGTAGYAVLHPTELGDWAVVLTYEGVQKTKVYTLEVIGVVEVLPYTVEKTLEETSWADIDIISRLGIAQNYWKVGDQKTFTVNGVSYAARILGFDHDVLTTADGDRTKAGISFEMVDCLNTTYPMNSASSGNTTWRNCTMRTTTVPTILNQLSADLKNVLKSVNKLTSAGNDQSTLVTTSDKLFLLSEIEIFNTTENSYAGEGTQYAYYAAGNSKIKKVNNTPSVSAHRSPAKGNSFYYTATNASGNVTMQQNATKCGMSFGFCV